MHRYFEIVNLAVPCAFILKDGTRFCLQTGIPNNSFTVYKTGFQYLGLKPGAEVLFKKESQETLLKLISQARRIEDVEVLALAKKSKVIKAAAAEKIAALNI
jgi:hypothetical protein